MRQPLSAAAISDVIGSIYDCAIEPQLWPATLAQIREELDFGGASLNAMAAPTGEFLLEFQSADANLGQIKRTLQHWRDLLALWGVEDMHTFTLGEPFLLSGRRDRSEWSNYQSYRELAPFGLRDIMGIGLARDSTMIGSLSFFRLDPAGDVGDIELEAVRLLAPHLRRAVTISKLLEVKTIVAATFATALDTIAVAVVLTDVNLRIVHANSAAQAMLASRNPIFSDGGRLGLRPSAAAAALGMAVEQASRNEAALGKRGFGIPVPGTNGQPCVLHVLPLSRGELRPGLAPSAVAAVFVAPAVYPPPTPHDALAALFDLTQAEARVFAHIAEGKTQAEVASALNVEASTVKTHLLHVFGKTGTHRQADLVRLAASMTLPL